MAIDPQDFKDALSQFGSGVTVVTTRDATGMPVGLTVSAFCSVSLDPPLVLVSIDNRSTEAHAGLRASRAFAVSVLAEGQEEWSNRFAVTGPDKFSGVTLSTSKLGLVLVPGALAQIECRLYAELPGGDHTIYLGEVIWTAVRPGRPLLYQARGYRKLQ